MSATLLPDVERLLSAYLREHDDVAALVGERVYTAFPQGHAADEPFVLLVRVGGSPVVSTPLVVDAADVQIDAYGGPKALAHEVISTVRAALVDLTGQARPEGVVAGVRHGALRWLPDESYDRPRPRYVADVVIFTKPAGSGVAARPVEAPTQEVVTHGP